MKKTLLTLALISFSYFAVIACSCQGNVPFCTLNSNSNYNVFIGKIVQHDSLFTTFQVLDNLRGNDLRDTILIYDYQYIAPPTCNDFEESKLLGMPGDSLLIILDKIDSTYAANYWGTIGDYYMPVAFCATPYIHITNQLIIGNVTGSTMATTKPIDSIPMNLFVSKYIPSSNNNDCDLFVGLTENFEVDFTISPNPTKDFVNLNVENPSQIQRINLYSIKGKLIFSKNKSVNRVSLGNEPNGVYFIQVDFRNGERLSKKIVKN